MIKDPIYIIGDVHGMYDQLSNLLVKIRSHKLENKVEGPVICFVGDYIDRGPDSKRVLELVREMQDEKFPSGFREVIALKGNHEEMMIGSRTMWHFQSMWLSNGGHECLESFGVKRGDSTKITDIIGQEMFDWVENLEDFYELNNIAVAHAGIDLVDYYASEHTSEQLLWSRGLRMHAHNIYKYTVHGHTPMKAPIIGEHTAYIDTGAVFGFKLSCLYIPNTVEPDHTKMEIIDE